MDFKKPFKVLTTAALIASLSISGTTMAHATDNNESKVSQKDLTADYNLSKVVLDNSKRKIAVSLDDYIAVAGNEEATNFYDFAYIQDGNGNSYSIDDYVGYFNVGDEPSKVIEQLAKADKKVNIDNVEEGQIKDGRLTTTIPNTLSTPEEIKDADAESITLKKEGTYGGTEAHPQVIEGDVTIENDRVNLSNVIIKGKLTIDSSVKSGEVIVDNTTVEGNTYVKGGGLNSIFFQDSVIATVIVNKNDGSVRVVTTGATSVEEVKLESYAKLEESGLTNGSEGFTDVLVDPTVQVANGGLEAIEFIGEYETINSKAYRVKINLPENTVVEKIALDAIATIIGSGKINEAEINSNASGSVFNQNLRNVVLNDAYIDVNGERLYESTSEATSAELMSAELTPDSLSFTFSNYVANIQASDFDLEATIDDVPVDLEDIEYDSRMKRLFFYPLVDSWNIGKKLKVKVTPKGKLTGEPIVTSEITLQEGFSGRITNVQGSGISNAKLKFVNYEDSDIEINTTTDQYGYYYANAPAGEYKGEITGDNLVKTTMYPYTSTNRFTRYQNETAIATAASSELRIMLTWGEKPRDVDSHLVGLTASGEPFHVYYADRISYENGLSIIDLDHDDTDSYGPETTTFRKLNDGQYIFYLHNYSGNRSEWYYDEEKDDYVEGQLTSTLDKSQAIIQVMQGDSDDPIQEIKFDTGNGKEELYYYAFGIEISNKGKDVKIVPIKKFDDYVNNEQLANLKTYLPKLIEDGNKYLRKLQDEKDATGTLSEEKAAGMQSLITAVAEATNTNVATANFEQLLDATLNLKIILTQVDPDYYSGYYYDYEYDYDYDED